MGMMIEALCDACGSEDHVTIGHGLRGGNSYSGWPVACWECGRVRGANTRQIPLRCTTCKSEDVAPYIEGPIMTAGTRTVESWEQLKLTDGDCLCPNCGRRSLHFHGGGILFD